MRLFVGVELPFELREKLAEIAGGLPGARWVPAENYHLTLRFIGEVAPNTAEEIDLALAALRGRSFPLVLSGVGVFEKGGRAVALWAGVERCQRLDHLQAKIETALQRAGLEPVRRRFAPHVTLARLDNAAPHRLVSYLQARSLFRTEPTPVDHFTLFSSRLGKEAPVYIPEVEYALERALA
jgi:2'-5' RNA ligase